LRSGAERLPSITSNVWSGESEENINGNETLQTEGQLELKPVDSRTGFKPSVVGGNDVREETGKAAIVKTVQVSQYSS
jgi:hypothetical protein